MIFSQFFQDKNGDVNGIPREFDGDFPAKIGFIGGLTRKHDELMEFQEPKWSLSGIWWGFNGHSMGFDEHYYRWLKCDFIGGLFMVILWDFFLPWTKMCGWKNISNRITIWVKLLIILIWNITCFFRFSIFFQKFW